MDKRVALPPPPPQWVLDLNNEVVTKTKANGASDPPGYIVHSVSKRGTMSSKQAAQPVRRGLTPEETTILKIKKAWEVALAPAKSIPISAIGMYMTGNSLQVFSIFMVFSLFKTPIQALLSTNAQFTRYESAGTKSQMWIIKIVFVLCNLLALGLGVYKVDKMGLLPTTRSDWLAWETQRMPLERAYPKHSF